MLSKGQINEVARLIQQMLKKARDDLNGLDKLFDEDFARRRRTPGITALVYSAFKPEDVQIEGIRIERVYYGQMMCLPEFHINDSVIQLYNHTANPFGTNEIISKVLKLGDKFRILEFTVSKDYYLEKLELITLKSDSYDNRTRAADKQVVWRNDTMA